MFGSAVQPGVVSLFSSTGSKPLCLFETCTDPLLPADSAICLLKDSDSLPRPQPPATLIASFAGGDDSTDYPLDQTVLHIQSPTLRSTFVRCPPSRWPGSSARGARDPQRSNDLGMEHPWMHLQVRNMGREWSFEVGLVDQSGREGIVRCSTFQKEPRLKLGALPLLHLPLAFPPQASHPLTSWCTLALNLPSLLPHFSSASLVHTDDADDSDDEQIRNRAATSTRISYARVPSGVYSHVSYVKIYATCRLRRIWFSASGSTENLPWEFQLYAAT